eukprot:5592095-Pyramimonas_sp.AAC.1
MCAAQRRETHVDKPKATNIEVTLTITCALLGILRCSQYLAFVDVGHCVALLGEATKNRRQETKKPRTMKHITKTKETEDGSKEPNPNKPRTKTMQPGQNHARKQYRGSPRNPII